MARHRDDIAALNHISAILIDAERLYSRAARMIEDDADALGRIERTIGERTLLLREFQQRVRDLRGKPQTDGSMLGVAHKAFFDVRTLFDRDLHAALAEVERGEKYLRDEIRKSMRRGDLGAETRAFLGVALDQIVSGEMRIEGKLEELEHMPPPQRPQQSEPRV